MRKEDQERMLRNDTGESGTRITSAPTSVPVCLPQKMEQRGECSTHSQHASVTLVSSSLRLKGLHTKYESDHGLTAEEMHGASSLVLFLGACGNRSGSWVKLHQGRSQYRHRAAGRGW